MPKREEGGIGNNYSSKGWIGVDLDGTLAEYNGWISKDHIGKPIDKMLIRVKGWIEEGKRVKIFTARCGVPEQIPPIRKWLETHGLGKLEITNVKDFAMIELWDDRCVRVVSNTGEPCCSNHDIVSCIETCKKVMKTLKEE